MFPVILFLYSIRNQSFLHVVADHGRREIHAIERIKIGIDILHCLLQIQSHVGDILILGQMEDAGRFRDFFSGFCFHGLIISCVVFKVNKNSAKVFG